MMKQAVETAVAYYTAFGNKKIEEVEQYLHPTLTFTDPQEKVEGKENVLKAAQSFMKVFKGLTIRSKFWSEEQVVIVYDLEFPNMEKALRAASMLSFKEGLISKIELIYDMGFFQRGS